MSNTAPVQPASQKFAYICQGCEGLYWAKVDCDCNTKAAFDMVLVSPIAQPMVKEFLTDAQFKALCEKQHAESIAEWTHPAEPANDALDAARYRWLRGHENGTCVVNGELLRGEKLDRAVDGQTGELS